MEPGKKPGITSIKGLGLSLLGACRCACKKPQVTLACLAHDVYNTKIGHYCYTGGY